MTMYPSLTTTPTHITSWMAAASRTASGRGAWYLATGSIAIVSGSALDSRSALLYVAFFAGCDGLPQSHDLGFRIAQTPVSGSSRRWPPDSFSRAERSN